MENAQPVNKEDLPTLHFVSYDVLETPEQRAKRKNNLEDAMKVSNMDKAKSIIYFVTNDGIKFVETTVWAATDETVVFKGGVSIPTSCVLKVL